ncbi:Rhodanese-like domain containing protein [Histomonas meleagridis]|uniref:Rhodanese-like domain containing protein n=1 Tax=Histomonas meleagridis TaxID=135588 RepID=UPI00355991A4|nr:Rhodanese-like domain containing protein [Histomonas meleagridis]KAH0798408.1 Rhodanese-like domain containing protein [Histomonas meleagridis]
MVSTSNSLNKDWIHGIPTPDEFMDENDCSIHDMYCPRYGSINDAERIMTHDQLAEIMKDTSLHRAFKRYLILDVRFFYEYEGGHILGARHIRNRSELISLYNSFKDVANETAVIIHCEYSQERGPKVFSIFLEHDRNQNLQVYPNKTYPYIFLLQGGYKTFWENHPDLCRGDYVPMHQREHVENKDIQRCYSYFRKYMLQEQNYVKRSKSAIMSQSPFFLDFPLDPNEFNSCSGMISSQPV